MIARVAVLALQLLSAVPSGAHDVEEPTAVVVVPAAARAAALVATMNQTEKISMACGVWGLGWGPAEHPYVGNVPALPRVGTPWLSLQDGPQGYRDGKYGRYGGAAGTATQWPSGMTVAATFDPALARAWGAAMGAEFRAKGANVQLGPGMNVARVPRGGRNFEYMSGEDPALGAAMVGPTVRGIQSAGVVATAKHYLLNNQEDHRGNMSSNADLRTLMQIYHPPFQAAVDAGVGAVMCGYNRVNGAWACENNVTLNSVLKAGDRAGARAWNSTGGFDGWVMSDWGGTHSTVAAANAGLDQEMPGGGHFTQELLGAALRNGSVTQSTLDGMATRVLTSMYGVGIMDTAQPTGAAAQNATGSGAHAALAQQLAESAAVLLHNDGDLLPLNRPGSSLRRIAVIGAAANCEEPAPDFGFGWPVTVGCVNSGGGSGGVDVLAGGVESILAALRRRTLGLASPVSITYHNGSDAAAAAAAAAAADVAVVVVGTTSSEGTDRPSTALPAAHLAYLRAVAAAQPRTAVALMTPGAVTMDWARPLVRGAVLCFFLPGQAQGAAVAAVLFGDANPSGRLPITMPSRENEVGLTAAQYPGVAFADGLQTSYSERLLVGYRWYHARNATPAFCFGHGESFTEFAYSALQAPARLALDAADAGASAANVTCTVKNTGSVAGAEIAQLYITFPPSAGEPPRQLKSFAKIALQPGESVQVTLSLAKRDLAVWAGGDAGGAHGDVGGWALVPGKFEINVGASSCDLRLSAAMVVSTTVA